MEKMINKLITNPEFANTPIFFEYIKKQGYTKQLLFKYVKSGWLEKPGYGVYKKARDLLIPRRIVYAGQQQLKKQNIYISLFSALSEAGLGHNIRFYEQLQVCMNPPYFKQQWLLHYPVIKWYRMDIFNHPQIHIVKTADGIKIAAPERALIELISLLPRKAAYEEIKNVMTMATTLRTRILQELLQDCKSIRTLRLFFFVARQTNPPWLKRISIIDIYAGQGIKRIVSAGGTLDKETKLIIPKEWKHAG